MQDDNIQNNKDIKQNNIKQNDACHNIVKLF